MSDFTKTRPDDGSEEEKKEQEEKELEQEAQQKEEKISEEKALEDFVAQAESEHDRIEQQKKEELEKLKRDRKKSKEEEDREQSEKGQKKLIYGQKVDPQKTFEINKGSGMFNSKGRMDNFGTFKAKRDIKRIFREKAKGISIKKQREFVQLFEKFHTYKREKSFKKTDREELMKFEAGMRRGSADAQFNKFREELKEDGVIKNSAGIRRIFTKREAKKMSNALLGREDHNTYKRVEKADLMSRRAGSSPDSKSTRRP